MKKQTTNKQPAPRARFDRGAMGRRIKRTRTARGWRQLDLAIKTGIPVSTISAYEVGIRAPVPANLVRIAAALRRSLDFLLVGAMRGRWWAAETDR